MNTLFVTIKRTYFDQILSGEKKKEFRLQTPYWEKKLIGRKYDIIIFQAGYSKTAPRMTVEYLGYRKQKIQHEFFGSEKVSVFAINLGKIKSVANEN